MDYSRTWPQIIFEEYRNTVNLVGMMSARKFTAFPNYDHESSNNNQLPSTYTRECSVLETMILHNPNPNPIAMPR